MFTFCTLIKDSVLGRSSGITIDKWCGRKWYKSRPSTGHDGILGDGV